MMTEYDPNNIVLDVLTFKNEDDWESSPVKQPTQPGRIHSLTATDSDTSTSITDPKAAQLPGCGQKNPLGVTVSLQQQQQHQAQLQQIHNNPLHHMTAISSSIDFKGETVGSGGSRRPNVPDSHIIFCSNVDYQAEVDELRGIEAFKNALHVGMPIWINKDTGQMMNKGFGFVYFGSEQQCVEALKKVEQCGEIILGPRNNPNNIRPVRFSQSDKAHKKRNGYHDFGYQPHQRGNYNNGGGYGQPPRGMHHHTRGRGGYAPRGGYPMHRPAHDHNRGDYSPNYNSPPYSPQPTYPSGPKPYTSSPPTYDNYQGGSGRRGSYYPGPGGYSRGGGISTRPQNDYYGEWTGAKRNYYNRSPQGEFGRGAPQVGPPHSRHDMSYGKPSSGVGHNQEDSGYGGLDTLGHTPSSSFYNPSGGSLMTSSGPSRSVHPSQPPPPIYGKPQYAPHNSGQGW